MSDKRTIPLAQNALGATVSFFILHSSLFISPVSACQLCFPLPARSAADSLIESELVVFARENPDKPFSYRTVRVLKGHPGEADPIDLFVNSATRRRLAAYPNDVAVLVRTTKQDSWRALTIADREYQQIVERILVFSHEWKESQGAKKRAEYFLGLFGHENPSVYELAFLELGRAPCEMISGLSESVLQEDLRPILTRREYIEWRPVAMRLLAQASGK